MLGLSRNALAMVAGFIIGLFVNRWVELKGAGIVPYHGTPVFSVFKGDDAVLLAIGAVIAAVGYFVKGMKWLFYFGVGFIVAIAFDELMEVILGEEA